MRSKILLRKSLMLLTSNIKLNSPKQIRNMSSLFNLPKQMTYVHVATPGGPDQLVLGQRTLPELGPDEVLIKVASAGLNRADCNQREGKYPVPLGATSTLGLEASGTVVYKGDLVKSLSIGQEVCALLIGGGYAEYVAVPAVQCLPIPIGVALADAAALPEACATVWYNIAMRSRLAPSESILIQGGTSGIGVTAIQIFSALGHPVYATAGSDEKAQFCEALGARAGINYRRESFEHRVLELTQGRGVDVILDMVGGDYLSRQLTCLASDGRIAGIAAMSGATVTINLMDIYRRRLTLTGSALRPLPIQQKGEICQQVLQHVWPLLENKRFKPIIHQRFAFRQAAEAHRLMESNQHIGKILLYP
jgi:NADPH:quinone reductase